MAKYTVELREIVKSGAKIFNFEYDFYDETKKSDFEQKFVNHFYFREIGTETVGRFQHYLKCKCHEVLPFYNEMMRVAAMDYDLINNYNLTETFSKTNSSTKTSTDNTNQTGTSSGSTTNNNTLNRSADIDTTSKKTNTLDSTTKHNELNETETVQQTDETGKLDKTSTLDIDGKTVRSDTPNGLLAMTDIKTNVYASEANIEDATNKTVDTQTNSANKKNTTTDNATINVSDNVDATAVDDLSENRDEDITETNSGTVENSGTLSNTTKTDHSDNDNGKEDYTLQRVGNIGVDAPSDMLRKHIEFQRTIRTAYLQFFDECEDLFMQIF
jgi:hypothetical protein